jgi:zinc transport system substrate-binding protein
MTYKVYLFVFAVALFAACHGPSQIKKSNAINVSIEPQKYLIDRMSGGKYTVNVVVKMGQNHETYEPTPQQMVQLEQSDLYLVVALNGFDNQWAQNLKSRNKQMEIIDLSTGIEPLVADHDCSGHNHDHHSSMDPHLWVSPSTMKVLAFNTYKVLRAHFAADSSLLDRGYHLLSAEIDSIDNLYKTHLQPFAGKTFMVYHPVLGYVARDYGLTQLPIELEGKEPSVEDIRLLIERAREQQVNLIFVQKEFDTRNAALIAEETGASIETLNPLNYSWQEESLAVLEKLTVALSKQ